MGDLRRVGRDELVERNSGHNRQQAEASDELQDDILTLMFYFTKPL
jgi:hypothetical protein